MYLLKHNRHVISGENFEPAVEMEFREPEESDKKRINERVDGTVPSLIAGCILGCPIRIHIRCC